MPQTFLQTHVSRFEYLKHPKAIETFSSPRISSVLFAVTSPPPSKSAKSKYLRPLVEVIGALWSCPKVGGWSKHLENLMFLRSWTHQIFYTNQQAPVKVAHLAKLPKSKVSCTKHRESLQQFGCLLGFCFHHF